MKKVLTKAQIENENIKTEIANEIIDKSKTVKEIADAIGQSTQKVLALLQQMNGVVTILPEWSKDPKRYKVV